MARYTIDLDDTFDKLLSKVAEEKRSTKAQAIRDAVASYGFLKKQLQDSDLRVSITDKDGKVLKDIQLP
jgi:predicted transcriptional regulator